MIHIGIIGELESNVLNNEYSTGSNCVASMKHGKCEYNHLRLTWDKIIHQSKTSIS